MSKSRKLHRLITELKTKSYSTARREEDGENKDEEEENKEVHEIEEEEEKDGYTRIRLQDFPGGYRIFEMVAKFCYGVKIDFSVSNLVPLRCATEHLEITEECIESIVSSASSADLSLFGWPVNDGGGGGGIGLSAAKLKQHIRDTNTELWLEDLALLSSDQKFFGLRDEG